MTNGLLDSSHSRVILITGASSGIGHATAKLLIDRGHTVYGTARRAELMDDLVAAGGHAFQLDVTDDDSVARGVQRVLDEQGRIDGLFANAGYCLLGPAELCAPEQIQRQFDVNVVGTGRAVAAVLPHMRERGRGNIAITSSAAGHVAVPCMPWYCATKHAQQGFADGLRTEVRPFGIQVSVIEPGYIRTDIADASLSTLDEAEAHRQAAAYRPLMERFRRGWQARISGGASPDTIARVAAHALTARRARRRYHPNFEARAAFWLKRFAPARLVETVAARSALD